MPYNNHKNHKKRGVSLIEAIFGAAIFALLAVSIYQGYASLISLISLSREKVIIADLINEEFEVIRNMPFSNIGLVGGIPSGILVSTTTKTRDGRAFEISRTIRNIDDPFDGTIGGDPNDLSPADYKMVQVAVVCTSCKNSQPTSAVANFAPKNLESASTNGALFIKVFDANGIPVSQADVSVVNSGAGVNISEVTNNNGELQIVDAPPGQNAYRITVTKSGYTTDRTYATSTQNPNPAKPDATVLLQQVTQVSFVIDKVSTINIFSKDLQCASVPDVSFDIAGAKLIGTNPDVLKWSGSFSTDSSGQRVLNNIEWDTFTLTPGSGSNIIGVNPTSPFSVLPDSVQNVDMIVGSAIPNALLVTVLDGVTLLPLSDAHLTLDQGSNVVEKYTGRGYLSQTDWSGGSGQSNFTNTTRYFSDDGNIDINSPDGELKLVKTLGNYVSSGVLTSSIFDTGTTSNFTNILWIPTDQPSQAGTDSVKMQFASSIDNTATTTWSYFGSDGTSGSYYTLNNNNISSVHNGDRYFRYKIFLSTEASNKTPNISDLAVTYTSECVPPGQAIFDTLSSGNHDLTIEKSGYQTQVYPVNIITNGDWQSVVVYLQPQ